MKGIIGAVRCDEEGCPNMFLDDGGIRIGHADALAAASDAERKAVESNWAVDPRGKVRHYCPNHAQERKLAADRRAEAFKK
jgi:hypothetical protein